MSRQKIFLIIFLSLILLVLILAGVVYDWKFFKPLSDEEIREKAAFAIKEGNLVECDKAKKIVDDVDYRTVCRNNIFLNKAITELDFNACAGLDDKLISIADCQNQVMSGLIQKEKSLSVCDKAPENLKQTCPDIYWIFIASEQKNPEICKNTSSEKVRLECGYNILISLINQSPQSINCSLFNNITVKTDCQNYQKRDCMAIKEQFLTNICQRGYE